MNPKKDGGKDVNLDCEFLQKTKGTRFLAKLVRDTPELIKTWGTSIAQDFEMTAIVEAIFSMVGENEKKGFLP